MKETKSVRIPVLVVDDSLDFCRFVKGHLEATGDYAVHIACCAKQAMEEALRVQPHLLLLDIVLPESNGGELFLQLTQHKQLRQVPTIFLSGLEHPWEPKSLGSVVSRHLFLQKPILPDQLVYAVGKVLQGS